MLLKRIRERIRERISERISERYPNKVVRLRSSSNAEDLLGFNGAGLYESVGIRPDEREPSLEDGLRRVWASLYLSRAYDDRALFGIEQDQVAMAVLVHPAFCDERANGVLITRNLFDPARGDIYTINAQAGEASATNPAPAVTTEQLIYQVPPRQPMSSLLGQSNLIASGQVLSDAEIGELGCVAEHLNQVMRPLFAPNGTLPPLRPRPGMEVDGARARPYHQASASLPFSPVDRGLSVPRTLEGWLAGGGSARMRNMSHDLPEIVDGLPNLCGEESRLRGPSRATATEHQRIDFGSVRAGFACALHMHQPLIPAGGGDLATAPLISNLRHMFENQHLGDNHNAGAFHWCYKRMGEFIPQLIAEGKRPRVMLEYSGTLLFGLREMGLHDVFDALIPLAQNPEFASAVEFLGAPFGHAVAPSTPTQDFRLHVQAFRHHFAAIFGLEAAERLQGFSPSEMALPNHPDVAHAFVRTLRDAGYRWVFLQEHTVEAPGGHGLLDRHVPHRLVTRHSNGDTASIIAIIKTQGSDTKLVAQMQPAYEARGLGRTEVGGRSIPRLVSQIADGENGGVMMNEFPFKFLEVMREASHSETPPVNVSEYLTHLEELGLTEADFPECQPLFSSRIWSRYQAGSGPERLKAVIEELKREDHRFHVEGGSWTSDLSWVRGYDSVLQPMERASAAFSERLLTSSLPTSDPRYRRALFHLLVAETSCFRYWGEGVWTDYGRELARRALVAIDDAVR